MRNGLSLGQLAVDDRTDALDDQIHQLLAYLSVRGQRSRSDAVRPQDVRGRWEHVVAHDPLRATFGLAVPANQLGDEALEHRGLRNRRVLGLPPGEGIAEDAADVVVVDFIPPMD